MTRWLLVGIALISVACGGDSPTAPTSPTPPPVATPPPTPPAPPQTPTLAVIAGQWSGSFELQVQGQRVVGTITLNLQQDGREITGSWEQGRPQNAPSGYIPWSGRIRGDVALNGAETRFTGTATIVAETDSGTGACRGTVALEGPSTASSLRWTGPNVVFENCGNTVGGFVWIVSR